MQKNPNHPGMEPPGQEGPYNKIVWTLFLASSVLVMLFSLVYYRM